MKQRQSARVMIMLLTLSFLAIPVAYAWDFKMEARFTWDYTYYSQMGPRGFFGPYNEDSALPLAGGASSANGWLGNSLSALVSSGTDAANAVMTFDIFPEFTIDRAVRVKGQYHVGGWGFSRNVSDVKYPADVSTKHWDPVGSLISSTYSAMTVPGINNAFSPGYWNTLWVACQMPWGTLVAGKRPLRFGIGSIFDGGNNTSTETILLVVPYGPIRMGLGCYPWRRILDQAYVDPPRVAFEYYNPLDKSSGRQYDVTAFITYDAGAVSLGMYVERHAWHAGPESVNDPAVRKRFIPQNLQGTVGAFYLKYFNGGFFLNAEADCYYETNLLKPNLEGGLRPPIVPVTIQGALTNTSALFQKNYIEHWRMAVEAGAVFGPAKISFLWAWIPGPDRRHGIVIDRQPSVFHDLMTNGGLFKPYSMIMVSSYGTGNNSISLVTSSGYVTDANTYGARLDYAPAANMTMYCSFLWAERLSQGYGWGLISPQLDSDAPDPTPTTNGVATGFVEYLRKGTVSNPSPAIPDSHIGYEVAWGVNWKVLEHYTIKSTFGYFKPGNWFKFACVDRRNPGWKKPDHSNLFGINPNREIDPIFALDIQLVWDF